MTNEAILAIMALDIPERQLRFLLALGTFARGQHGWRKAGTKLLAAKARLSPTTAVKARGELVKAGTVEFVRGTGHGLSAYRITLPGIADHLVGADDESTNNAGDLPGANNAGDLPGTNNAGDLPGTNNAGDLPGAVEDQPGFARAPTGPSLTTRPNAPASGNANEGSSTYGSQPSGHPRRTTRTGSRAEPAATDDDDDSSIQLDGSAEGVRDRPGPGYGLCPECRDWQIVQGYGGTLRRHSAYIRGGRHYCPGSGREPVEPVPCVGCGRTDVALTGFAGLCYACREAAKAAEPDDEVPW